LFTKPESAAPSTANEARWANGEPLASISLPASASTAPERASARLITRTAATVITAGLLNPANAASGSISPSTTQTMRLVIATTS
jgi:hypothetical protein